MITVVNIKRKEPYDIYIGRKGKGQDGFWGNPLSKGTREENIAKFEKYLLSPRGLPLMKALPELLNKRLGCFCKPEACHGDILKKYAEEQNLK